MLKKKNHAKLELLEELWGFWGDLVLEGKTSRKQGLPKPSFWIVGVKDPGIWQAFWNPGLFTWQSLKGAEQQAPFELHQKVDEGANSWSLIKNKDGSTRKSSIAAAKDTSTEFGMVTSNVWDIQLLSWVAVESLWKFQSLECYFIPAGCVCAGSWGVWDKFSLQLEINPANSPVPWGGCANEIMGKWLRNPPELHPEPLTTWQFVSSANFGKEWEQQNSFPTLLILIFSTSFSFLLEPALTSR